MSVFTLIRCRNTWPFILIAVWKMVLSATIASIAWHANYLAVKERRPSQLEPPFAAVANAATHLSLLNVSPLGDSPDFSASLGLPRKKFRSLLWWTAFYFLGAIVGLVGILAIVFETMENSRVRIITYVFGCVVGLGVVVAVSYIMSGRSDLGPGGFGSRVGWSLAAAIGVAIFEMLFLIAFYTDWVLAALAGDMLGVHLPTANLASALIYFFAKRAPMLSR
ncbi:hypothetical protein B0H67DRAFT_588803 [Lasiosphaeris hirsuta]|uniref:Uncharacterized protein n=1 Tax=Lasiosphaeris hirsuta TaxID=260670 RepID=A0AA40A255_9PEZI|nr:hypothetical protein B0H67DRAFT_588803 [Lasiosphaeris hirsuta]